MYIYGDFPKLGVPFWGPNNKDYSILGSILGSLYFGKLPYVAHGSPRDTTVVPTGTPLTYCMGINNNQQYYKETGKPKWKTRRNMQSKLGLHRRNFQGSCNAEALVITDAI